MTTYQLRYEPSDDPHWTLWCSTERVADYWNDSDSEPTDEADTLLRQCGEHLGYWRAVAGEWEVDTTGGHEPDGTPVGRVAWEVFLDRQSELRPAPTRWQLIAYWRNTDRDVYYERARRYLATAAAHRG